MSDEWNRRPRVNHCLSSQMAAWSEMLISDDFPSCLWQAAGETSTAGGIGRAEPPMNRALLCLLICTHHTHLALGFG